MLEQDSWPTHRSEVMKALTTIGTLYLVICVLLLAPGVGIGFLLHWVLPEVDLGIGILIGVVATGFSTHFFVRATASLAEFREAHTEESLGLHRIYFADPAQRKRYRRKRESTE